MPETKLMQYAQGLHRQTRTASQPRLTRTADLNDRQLVTVLGTVHSLILRPRAGVPALEAEIEDGTGRVTCVWLGRRAIRGISAGRDIEVTGRVARRGGEWVIYNPNYLLRPQS